MTDQTTQRRQRIGLFVVLANAISDQVLTRGVVMLFLQLLLVPFHQIFTIVRVLIKQLLWWTLIVIQYIIHTHPSKPLNFIDKIRHRKAISLRRLGHQITDIDLLGLGFSQSPRHTAHQ